MLALAFATIGAGFGPYSSESIALRIQLVAQYCDEKNNRLQRTPAETASAAAKLPCLMLAYRKKLELTGPEKKKAVEAKATEYELENFRKDRITMFSEMCKKARAPAPNNTIQARSRPAFRLSAYF